MGKSKSRNRKRNKISTAKTAMKLAKNAKRMIK